MNMCNIVYGNRIFFLARFIHSHST
jgi:hypothetical protein